MRFARTISAVIRRTLTTVLWFAAGWATGGILAFLFGTPVVLAPVIGLAAGGFVAWDPMGKLWGPKPDRTAIRRRLSDLERVEPAESGVTPDRPLEPAQD
jgi:hypothetical protein